MTSDYLNTSNPYLLLAFFKYQDAANGVTKAIAELKVTDPKLRGLAVSMLASMRQQALIKAFELFDCVEFKAAYPPSWTKGSWEFYKPNNPLLIV